MRDSILKDSSKENWERFKSFEALDFFPWFNDILKKNEIYIKKGTRGFREMFELEKSFLRAFAVVPTRSFGGEMKFQLQCGCCKKGVIQFPISRDKFRSYAGSIIESHLFGSAARNELCFSIDGGAEHFHMEDIQVHQCTSFFTTNRVKGYFKFLMSDLKIKKHEVPVISKVTYSSFRALIEMMTDPVNLQKLEDHMLISNKPQIMRIEKHLRREGKEVNHGWEKLFPQEDNIIKESTELINDNMVDTTFEGPSGISMQKKNMERITDDTLLYYWTHIELIDPATRHPSKLYPTVFPDFAKEIKKPYYIGYSNLNCGGFLKEFTFLANINYTGTLNYSRTGELSTEFMRSLVPNVKTPLLQSDKKFVLQDAVIATRKRNIYSAQLKIRKGTHYGSKKNELGATYEIQVRERAGGPKYVVDEKHISDMYGSSNPSWVNELFDIRNAGVELPCPYTGDDQEIDCTMLYEVKKNVDKHTSEVSTQDKKNVSKESKGVTKEVREIQKSTFSDSSDLSDNDFQKVKKKEKKKWSKAKEEKEKKYCLHCLQLKNLF